MPSGEVKREERYVAIRGTAHVSGGVANSGGRRWDGVTWICSFVSEDRTRTFCVYDAPTPEAIRRTAARNELPVDEITRVSVLDPYFYA